MCCLAQTLQPHVDPLTTTKAFAPVYTAIECYGPLGVSQTAAEELSCREAVPCSNNMTTTMQPDRQTMLHTCTGYQGVLPCTLLRLCPCRLSA